MLYPKLPIHSPCILLIESPLTSAKTPNRGVTVVRRTGYTVGGNMGLNKIESGRITTSVGGYTYFGEYTYQVSLSETPTTQRKCKLKKQK